MLELSYNQAFNYTDGKHLKQNRRHCDVRYGRELRNQKSTFMESVSDVIVSVLPFLDFDSILEKLKTAIFFGFC
jgi:hypothetical protein